MGATVLVITTEVVETLVIRTIVIIVMKSNSIHNSHKGDANHNRL